MSKTQTKRPIIKHNIHYTKPGINETRQAFNKRLLLMPSPSPRPLAPADLPTTHLPLISSPMPSSLSPPPSSLPPAPFLPHPPCIYSICLAFSWTSCVCGPSCTGSWWDCDAIWFLDFPLKNSITGENNQRLGVWYFYILYLHVYYGLRMIFLAHVFN